MNTTFASNLSRYKSVWCLYGGILNKLIYGLLLLMPFTSFSQITGLESHLPSVLTKTLKTLQEVQERQENLSEMARDLKDSLNLRTSISKIKQSSLSEGQILQKVDSIHHAFAEYQLKLNQLQAEKQNLLQEINKLKRNLPEGLLPPEVKKMLETVKLISSSLPEELAPHTGFGNISLFTAQQQPQLNKFSPTASLTSQAKQVTEGPVDFFAGRGKELIEARRELRKYSSRLDEVKSLKDLKKGYLWLNPLKDTPWAERVVLGSMLQFSNQKQYHIDLSPNLAWRMTDLFSLGAGFQYRLSVSSKGKPWINSADKVYGYYTFFDGQILKGFFGRIQYENLNTLIPRPNPATQFEQVDQEWIKGLSVGIGKTYKFYKKINGYGLVQYNLLYRHNETPYLRPVQAKIGFFINGGAIVRQKQKQEKKEGSSNVTR